VTPRATGALVLLDHVLVVVKDLPAGARLFVERYRFRALEGGRHPGIGTANMIVPLGDRPTSS
jgi:hypothetical protein